MEVKDTPALGKSSGTFVSLSPGSWRSVCRWLPVLPLTSCLGGCCSWPERLILSSPISLGQREVLPGSCWLGSSTSCRAFICCFFHSAGWLRYRCCFPPSFCWREPWKQWPISRYAPPPEQGGF